MIAIDENRILAGGHHGSMRIILNKTYEVKD